MTDQTVPPFPVDAERESPPPTPPPPGTSAPTFWQSGGTKAALVITLGCAVDVACAAILGEPPSREALAAMLRMVAWAWGGACGISQWDTDALRWR